MINKIQNNGIFIYFLLFITKTINIENIFKVYVKKIRMGLETGEEPVILHDDEDDEKDQNNQLQSDYAPQVDPFDQLLDEQLSQVQSSQPCTPVTPHTAMSLMSSNQPRPPVSKI